VARGGHGAWLIDHEGTRLADYIMGWGALILGHAHPAVVGAAHQQLRRGPLVGLTHPAEVELARTIVEAIPSIEQVRFTASGTEACMTAVRLARAATGRTNVLTFEGCYHGHSDGLLVKRGSGLATFGLSGSAGVVPAYAAETIVVPYNNLGAVEQAVAQFGERIACAILEPVAANMGVVVPAPEFLNGLRAITARHGILLIIDEVVTGFRLTYGGAQGLVGVTPDLTVLGKIIGGGFPIGAIGGPRSIMQQLAPDGPVYHAGTFAGHPVTMVAGLATLQELKRRRPYAELEARGSHLAEALSRAARTASVSIQLNRSGSMLTLFFTDAPVHDFASAQRASKARFAHVAAVWRRHGILVPPSQWETMFLSTAHTPAMLEACVDAFAKACRTMPAP